MLVETPYPIFREAWRDENQLRNRIRMTAAEGDGFDMRALGSTGLKWESGWWFGCHQFYFPRNIGNFIIPSDFNIFQRGGPTTNQEYVNLHILLYFFFPCISYMKVPVELWTSIHFQGSSIVIRSPKVILVGKSAHGTWVLGVFKAHWIL